MLVFITYVQKRLIKTHVDVSKGTRGLNYPTLYEICKQRRLKWQCDKYQNHILIFRGYEAWPRIDINIQLMSLCHIAHGLFYTKPSYYHHRSACVAQSVTCLATDACLTADPGVASSIPARSHTFVEIDQEIISTIILLPSADSFKKGCCQLQAKVCAQITG